MLKPPDCPLDLWHILPLLGIGFRGALNLANVRILAVLAGLASIRAGGVFPVVLGIHMQNINLGRNGFERARY